MGAADQGAEHPRRLKGVETDGTAPLRPHPHFGTCRRAIRIQHGDLARNALGEVVDDVTWTQLRRAHVCEQGQNECKQLPGKHRDQMSGHVAKVTACPAWPSTIHR